MNATARLIDAICLEWTRCLPAPYGDGSFSAAVDGKTDCNRFVNAVCQKLDYAKFVLPGSTEPILANDMVEFMNNSLDWKTVNGSTAQWYANVGVVVIAGWKNPEGGHGHVCMIRPGNLGSSGKWGSDEVPRVANVSEPHLCFLDKGSNYAFSEEPTYYVLKDML